MPLVKLFATAICASWLVAVAAWFWLFVMPLLRLILSGVSGWEAAFIWIMCLTTMWCAVAVPYFFLGPPDTFSSFACGALCALFFYMPDFWTWTSVGTARGAGPASIWWMEGELILTYCVIWCCGLQRWTTYLWLTPSTIPFRTGGRPNLFLLVDMFGGGHGACYSSWCTLVSRVYRYATDILGSFLSAGAAPAHDVSVVTGFVQFTWPWSVWFCAQEACRNSVLFRFALKL